jgi:pantothenate kinase
MLGRSWWKILGYEQPCSCAYERDEQIHSMAEKADTSGILRDVNNLKELMRIANNQQNRLKREKKKEAERKKKASLIWKVRVKRSEPGAEERENQVVKHWTI